MNDHPIDVVREAGRKISEQFNHDPRKLVEHYKELQQRHEDRLIPSGSEPLETEDPVESGEPAGRRK